MLILNFIGKLKPLETLFHLRNSMVFLARIFFGFSCSKKKNQIVAAKEYYLFSLFRSTMSHKVELLLLVLCSTNTNTTASICC